MAHGVTLQMRAIKHPAPTYLVRYEAELDKNKVGMLVRVGAWEPYRNPERDRSLPGKARIRARKAGRFHYGGPRTKALIRRYFFRGHGEAWETAANMRYDCPCGYGIVAPHDDLEFMTDVMEHETEHAERVTA